MVSPARCVARRDGLLSASSIASVATSRAGMSPTVSRRSSEMAPPAAQASIASSSAGRLKTPMAYAVDEDGGGPVHSRSGCRPTRPSAPMGHRCARPARARTTPGPGPARSRTAPGRLLQRVKVLEQHLVHLPELSLGARQPRRPRRRAGRSGARRSKGNCGRRGGAGYLADAGASFRTGVGGATIGALVVAVLHQGDQRIRRPRA